MNYNNYTYKIKGGKGGGGKTKKDKPKKQKDEPQSKDPKVTSLPTSSPASAIKKLGSVTAKIGASMPKIGMPKIGMPTLTGTAKSKGALKTAGDVLETFLGVIGTFISLPVRNLDELIPPELCKEFVQNDYVCSQSILNYFFTGSKEDYKKILLNNENGCLEYDETGNKIVECRAKPPVPTSTQNPIADKSIIKGGHNEMIIDCEKTYKTKFKQYDRIQIQLDDKINERPVLGTYVTKDNKKWFLGTIKSAKGKYLIELDNGDGEMIEVYYDKIKTLVDKDHKPILDEARNLTYGGKYSFKMNDSSKLPLDYDKIIKLEDDWNAFKKDLNKMTNEFVTMPELRKIINKYRKQLHNFLISNVYTYFNILYDKIQTSGDFLFTQARNIIKEIEKQKTYDIFHKKMYGSIILICTQIKKGEDIEKILRMLKVNEARINKAIGKKVEIILEKLSKINSYLRKYECPRNKLVSLVRKINDKILLGHVKTTCENLINNDPASTYESSLENKNRAESCDTKYLKEGKLLSLPKLSIVPDAKHIRFLGKSKKSKNETDTEKETKCKRCHEPWIPMLGKYACLLSSSLFGSKNNINYVLIEFMHDISQEIKDTNPFKKIIIAILKNINCRSDLIKVLEERINEIDSKK